MTYYDRQFQLNKTLESFRQYDPDEYDFSVVIVNDGSPEEVVVPPLPFEVKVLPSPKKLWSNPTPAFNRGFNYALTKNPDIIIIQNAECYHWGDVLGYAKKVTDETYIPFGCYSQGKGEEPGSVINNRCATIDGESAWYDHPIYHPRFYHWCSAITTSNLIKLNGFDERFIHGLAFDDDYFLNQIRCLGLKIEMPETPFVIHQWHPNYSAQPNSGNLWAINEELFRDLSKENNYRAQHLITPDLQ